MEQITLDKDVVLFYVTASSFPEGIMPAFDKLAELVPQDAVRMNYGVSNPGRDGKIVYRAAVTAKQDEPTPEGCEVLTVRAGQYISQQLIDWKQDETSIGKTFQQLLADPRIDHNGACVEQYINGKDVICMVRLADAKV